MMFARTSESPGSVSMETVIVSFAKVIRSFGSGRSDFGALNEANSARSRSSTSAGVTSPTTTMAMRSGRYQSR